MRLSAFASVKLTIALMILIAGSILVGAWCPQESQVGFQKVVETFGAESARNLRQFGITDLFHTPFFLGLIGMLTVNMVACSVQRVFPKARLMKQKMPFIGEREISKFQSVHQVHLKTDSKSAYSELAQQLKKQQYTVGLQDEKLTAEWGKFSRLAATVTHIGLLSLLLGVTITSWTGFTGFKPVPIGGTLNFNQSEHSKLWIGKLPAWDVRVDDTRRENYASGDPKQWYSNLSVVDAQGKVLKTQEISVNNPLSFEGVDVYQSSWGLDSIEISFNGKPVRLELQQMGGAHAAFMPLDQDTTMIFSLRGQDKPLRVFAKIPDWDSPKKLAEIPQGSVANFGEVKVGYVRPIPVTGLQYKSDPGLPVTYFAFSVIMIGVMMAAVPHRQVWAVAVDEPIPNSDSKGSKILIGGISKKAKKDFERKLDNLLAKMSIKFGSFNPETNDDGADETVKAEAEVEVSAVSNG